MNPQPIRRSLACLVAAFAALMLTTAASASDMGQAAAAEVSEASYHGFLDTWLYTHVGDNRGFGPEHDLTQANIVELFESYGLEVTLEPVQYSGDTYYNVVGTKTGTVFPELEYVVGAHYDSVNNPGADDDASGVALVLETARIISQYDSEMTIRFVAFDREEQGLHGSQAYVNAHINDNIMGMVQADMVAYDPGTDHALIYGRNESASIKNALAESISLYSGGLSYTVGGPVDQSDHAPFEWAGFQACLLIEGEVWNNPFYHSPDDNLENPDNINTAYAVKMTRSVVGHIVDHAGVIVPVDSLEFDYPGGRPEYIDPAGGTTMTVAVQGVGAGVPEPGTGWLHYDAGAGWTSTPMAALSETLYEATFPAAACGESVVYYVSAETVAGETITDPWGAPDAAFTATAAYGLLEFFADDFEADEGWTVSGDASAGHWDRGVPVGGGDRGDPPFDDDGSGQCYLTGNTDGDSDVDDGVVVLVSPSFAVDTLDAEVRFSLWYTNNWGSDPNNDLFTIHVADGDGEWVPVETVGPETSLGWKPHAFRVGDFVDTTDDIRVRFEASDLNSGSVVEAGVDGFSVFAYECAPPMPADLNGDGVVDGADLGLLLAAWGTDDPLADLNGDGTVDGTDLGLLLGAWT